MCRPGRLGVIAVGVAGLTRFQSMACSGVPAGKAPYVHTRALVYRVSLVPQFQTAEGQLAMETNKATIVAHSVADMTVKAPDGKTVIEAIFSYPK